MIIQKIIFSKMKKEKLQDKYKDNYQIQKNNEEIEVIRQIQRQLSNKKNKEGEVIGQIQSSYQIKKKNPLVINGN